MFKLTNLNMSISGEGSPIQTGGQCWGPVWGVPVCLEVQCIIGNGHMELSMNRQTDTAENIVITVPASSVITKLFRQNQRYIPLTSLIKKYHHTLGICFSIIVACSCVERNDI